MITIEFKDNTGIKTQGHVITEHPLLPQKSILVIAGEIISTIEKLLLDFIQNQPSNLGKDSDKPLLSPPELGYYVNYLNDDIMNFLYSGDMTYTNQNQVFDMHKGVYDVVLTLQK